jgi:lipoate-protein ligase A
MTPFRLLPYHVADGPHNMAADEVLLHSATRGQASLRFYGWSEPTVSLGYFQAQARRREVGLEGLSFVRRPTGGDALVHHHELTYALAVPAGVGSSTRLWLDFHAVLAAALAEFGVEARLHEPAPDESPFTGFLCFQHFTCGDLMVGGFKVAGSAQRRQKGGLLQHGGLLLAASPHTPGLPGLRELTGTVPDPTSLIRAIVRHFHDRTGAVDPGGWTEAERANVPELVRSRYGSDAWNRRR